MSSVSEMQWKVNEARRENYELRNELNAIASGISNAYNRWDRLCNNISNTLHNGTKRVEASQNYMNAAYDMQGEIDNLYVLFKNIEMANKKIRECNNKKIYDFANYSAVRKIVSAMLDNLEVSLVSDETITRVHWLSKPLRGHVSSIKKKLPFSFLPSISAWAEKAPR